MSAPSMATNSHLLPGKGRNAKAYAAKIASATFRAAPNTVTISEFLMNAPKGAIRQAPVGLPTASPWGGTSRGQGGIRAFAWKEVDTRRYGGTRTARP